MKRTIIFLALAIFAVTVHAQRSSFFDKYMQLRQSQESEDAMFQQINREEIEQLLALPIPVDKTEAELQKFLREREMFENVEQIGFAFDTEISLYQLHTLLRPYERLVSMRIAEGFTLSLYGTTEEYKITELIGFMGDDDMIVIFNLLFREPFDIRELAENPENISELISINGTEEEQRNAIFSFNFSSSRTASVPLPGFDTEPFTLEVVQIDGKYIVRTVEEKGIFAYSRKLYTKPIILGSNPGNTYVMTFCNTSNIIILLDRYGHTFLWGEQMTPVNVLGCEEEIAAFIIRIHNLYSLFETPETYTLVERVDEDGRRFLGTPRERRIQNAQSIVVTEDGYFRVVKEDGAVEYIPIRSVE